MAVLYGLFSLALISTALGSDEKCSSYDYEEKLLMKTIQLENVIKDLTNKTAEIETNLEIEIKTLENAVDALNKRLNGMDYETKSCPSNYMYMDILKLCWRLETRKVHWFDAVKLCEEEGARLMIFNNTEQKSMVKEYIRTVNAQLVWIGASDFIEEGKFVWITGETVDGMTSSSSTSSNCLSVSRYGYDDEHCGGLYQPMCQITIE